MTETTLGHQKDVALRIQNTIKEVSIHTDKKKKATTETEKKSTLDPQKSFTVTASDFSIFEADRHASRH